MKVDVGAHIFLGENERSISQLGFAESKETANNRANIGGTVMGASIIG